MPPNCSRCARWRICTWRGKNCCSWHRLSPGAKVADHGRAAQAGGRSEKTESERLHRPSRTLTTSKTRAYSEFPSLPLSPARLRQMLADPLLEGGVVHSGAVLQRLFGPYPRTYALEHAHDLAHAIAVAQIFRRG